MPASAQRVPVLMYHRVDDTPDSTERRYCVSPARFRAQMERLAAAGMTACDIGAFLDWLEGKATLPQGAFLLTFDDGFLGVYDHAFPVLKELGWPFTVFLVSDRLGQSSDWSGDRAVAPRAYPLLGRTHVLEMQRAGVAFHSHTRRHLDLTSVDAPTARAEIEESRADLGHVLGAPVHSLAYPFGRHDDAVVGLVRDAGYRAAFSVQPGFNRRDVDPYRIRRIDVYGTDTPARLRRKVALGSNDGSVATLIRYYAGRLRGSRDEGTDGPGKEHP